MSTPTRWHLDPDALARYAAGEAGTAEAASAEAHLITCAPCRTALAAHADRDRLDTIYTDVVDALDAPRPGFLERLLTSIGVPPSTARVLVATPALRASWLLSVVGALVFAALAARRGTPEGRDLFLAVAPLLPVLGVAIAYGPRSDPSYEVRVATPFGGFRLMLLRTTAVLATTTALSAAAGLLVPYTSLAAAAWLLPALALTTLTLVAGTVWPPVRAAAAIGGGWVLAVSVAGRWDLDLTGPGEQVLYAALVVAGVALVLARRDRFEVEVGA